MGVAAEAFGHDGQVVANATVCLLRGECRQSCSADAVLGDLDELGRLPDGCLHHGEEGGVEEHDDLADGVAAHGHPLEPVAAQMLQQRLVPGDDDGRA
ncbi:hypothetical protein ACFYN3_39925 [Streptomyces lavendulae]|uniref:hypothetical protein n=1 Tax=Streptomyces lavendulae TaxID=1914 RepID=UPI0036CD862B